MADRSVQINRIKELTSLLSKASRAYYRDASEIMYEIPKDEDIGRVTITREYIEGTGGPIIDMRGVLRLEEEERQDAPRVSPDIQKAAVE